MIDVLPDPKSKRDKLYEISDPMLRIALASGENKDGFSGMVVDWIALWYNTAELKTQIKKHKNNIDELEIRRLALSRKAEILHIYYGEDELYIEIKNCIYENNLIEAKQILDNIPEEKKEINYYFARGMLNKKLKKYDDTIKDFEYILNNINQKEDFVLLNLGLVYNEISQFEKSINYIQKAIQYSKKVDGFYYQCLGKTYSNKSDYKSAIIAYKKALKYDPADITYTYIEMAYSYYMDNRFKESIEILEKVLTVDQGNIESHKYLFWNYLELDNFLLALDYYIRVLSIFTKQKDYKKFQKFENENLVDFIIALVKSKKTTKDEMIGILNKFHSFNIENPDYSVNIDILEVFYKVRFLNEHSALLNVSKEVRPFIEKMN